MTNISHWQEDIDEALGGDFDGSLSGLCIMSLSFDFSRNGNGAHVTNSGALVAAASNNNNNNSNNNNNNTHSRTSNYTAIEPAHCDNSNNCFKRFKSSLINDHNNDDESSNQSKISRLPRNQLKGPLSQSAPLSLGNTSSSINTRTSNTLSMAGAGQARELPTDRLSPQASRAGSCERAPSAQSMSSRSSSRSSTIGARSPSPSSMSTHSRISSRSQSPSDASVHSCHNQASGPALAGPDARASKSATQQQVGVSGQSKGAPSSQDPKASATNNENQHISLYSMNGGTLKESSYTTSVITTTAPMHFKNLHHPFSIKQFPLSPYHQFSNSSLNHDFYDRYLSHDSHQPLQTPLIGIERTQDLLSLKLPPHGPEDMDSHKFPKEWTFGESKQDDGQAKESASDQEKQTNEGPVAKSSSGSEGEPHGVKRKSSSSYASDSDRQGIQKVFPFNYGSNKSANEDSPNQREPMDLNAPFDQDDCCHNSREKSNMFLESMKHFNPDREQHNCYNLPAVKGSSSRAERDSPSSNNIESNTSQLVNQYTGQESVFGIDPSKQKFRYVLAAPISVASKLCEDTMTYLNQGQAYEIKLENTTDVAEARKGFMCSIINIGFYERHMQQAENELWQQWSQQHPNEKIFSVDMKLSYNVFGVESDGLNKYEFLWDSSKAAGVFIRINSISTEFTQKKHGGEKGVPFKLSIETFSYNSKTHDSYFISAACCQIKVFKPKGAERKIRSDRDKVSKRPLAEQAKYRQSCDHTSFKECSLTSLHPTAGDSLCYYRHSHGHFATKQTGCNASTNPISGAQSHSHQVDEDLVHANSNNNNNNNSISAQHSDISPENHMQPQPNRSSQISNDSENDATNNQRSFTDFRQIQLASKLPASHPQLGEFAATNRLLPHQQYGRPSHDDQQQADTHHYSANQGSTHNSDPNFGQSNEMFHLQQSGSYNSLYHGPPARCVADLPNMPSSQHLNIPYYGHSLPSSVQNSLMTPSSGYGSTASSTINTSSHSSLNYHAPPMHSQEHFGLAKTNIPRSVSMQDKQFPLSGPSCLSSPVKGTASMNSGYHHHHHHPSFPLYHSTGGAELVAESNQLAQKDSTTGPSYSDTHYDNHFAYHPLHHTSAQSQHQTMRHRSASMTVASTQGACANYAHSAHQMSHSKNGEAYAPVANQPEVPTSNSHHWMQGGPNHQLSSPSSIYGLQRTNSKYQDDNNHHYGDAGSGSSSVDATKYGPYHDPNRSCPTAGQYESDQNSPLKNHSTTSNSSSSCNSRFRNNLPSLAPVGGMHSQAIARYQDQRNMPTRFMQQISIESSCSEVVSWFVANRFGLLTKTFSNFSGSDLLRLSKTDMIDICGLSDGIRLYNSLHNQPIKPRRVLYVCYQDNDIFHPIYLHDLTLRELLEELSSVFITQISNNLEATVPKQRPNDEKCIKRTNDKTASTPGSSNTDSRSSMGAMSTETGAADELYSQNGEPGYLSESTDIHPARKGLQQQQQPPNSSSKFRYAAGPQRQSAFLIDRLLVDGLTSVKIMVTEQVVQIFENESVWTLSVTSSGGSRPFEACLSACHTKRSSK